VLDALADLVAIGVPEFLGETITDLFLRGGRSRWQRVASGGRKRAEDGVRFLRRNHVPAWIRPAGRSSYEVIVRTRDADVARALLDAPSSSRSW
jgi:hypothetical protein